MVGGGMEWYGQMPKRQMPARQMFMTPLILKSDVRQSGDRSMSMRLEPGIWIARMERWKMPVDPRARQCEQ